MMGEVDCKVCAYAEQWLRARHTPEWYIGDATSREWADAYTAANARYAPDESREGVEG